MDKRMREKKNEKTEIQDGGEEEDPIVQSVRCLKVKLADFFFPKIHLWTTILFKGI